MRKTQYQYLLIEQEPRKREEAMLLLGFLGESAVAIDSAGWPDFIQQIKNLPDEERPMLVPVFGELGPELEQEAVIEAIQKLERLLAVLFTRSSSSSEEEQSLPGNMRQCYSNTLRLPLDYPEVLRELNLVRRLYELVVNGGHSRSPATAALSEKLVGSSPAMCQIRDDISRLNGSEATILITGESGTGKEVVAREVHRYSNRCNKPFVAVNCGAIPENLLESELFGHVKGSFTGAVSDRCGRFAHAEGGTLFLDEIGDMPQNMQVKILRVLQEKVYEKVGDNTPHSADVRIIAATHRNLETMISEGEFRQDLYYRLNVFPIEIPPLRDRTQDIPALINHLQFEQNGRRAPLIQFSDEAVQQLQNARWPGNIRQLANLIERLSILHAHKTIKVRDLPLHFRPDAQERCEFLPEGISCKAAEEEPQVQGSDQAVRERQTQELSPAQPAADLSHGPSSLAALNDQSLSEYIASIEAGIIRTVLNEERGVIAHAADRLKVRRSTLSDKIRRYRINEMISD